MKSVLISIKPKDCELIANGKITIKVLKSRPKIETPFKCYIYCTNGLIIYGNGKQYVTDSGEFLKGGAVESFENSSGFCKWNGKVIGEFVCDSIEMINASCSAYGIDLFYHDCITQGCLTERDIEKYFNIPEDKDLRVMKGNGYAWHICDLKVYDKPKELSEFKRWNRTEENSPCAHTKWLYPDCKDCKECNLTRPPKNWCYVEEA